jgi:hypothetical protein
MIQLRRGLKKRTIIIGGILLLVIIAGVIAGILVQQALHKNDKAVILDTGYTTVLPTHKSIADLGGWKRVSPTASDPVYAYNDMIGTIAISVSEQPLPASFKNDTDAHIADLAKAYNATATTQVGDMIVYIGTSSKGPQSVIFTKNNLLILIKSEDQITNAAWSSYAASLQ